jgi:hypothetical protein
VHASGTLSLALNDQLDLDSALVNPGAGQDIIYQADASNYHQLAPQAGAVLGIYVGGGQPTRQACQAAAMSAAPITVESLPLGAYLCYRTDQNRPGWLRLNSFNSGDFSIGLDLLTWEP